MENSSKISLNLYLILLCFLVFTGILSAIFYLSRVSPFLLSHLTEIFGILFIITPIIFFKIHKKNSDIHFGDFKSGLFWGLLVSVLILSSYFIIHKLYFSHMCNATTSANLGRSCLKYKNGFSLTLSIWGVLNLFLIHMIAVAFPEEYFYRGFLLPLLMDSKNLKKFSTKYKVIIAVLIQAVCFALGHFLIDGNPLRLAVFFPALVMGVLFIKSKSLYAPIIFHGFANFISEILEKGYFM
jgi:membrane protease YdiL (CAAX protease family)